MIIRYINKQGQSGSLGTLLTVTKHELRNLVKVFEVVWLEL